MADRKISDLTALTAPAASDLLPIVDVSESTAVAKNKKITFQDLQRYYDSDSSNYVAFQSPATVSTNTTWTLPAADGSTGEVLTTNGSGTLSWAAAGVTAAGSADEIQFNDGSSGLAASSDLTWDDSGKVLGVGGDINLDDGGTYTTTLQCVTPTANRTISFPDATGTLGLVAGSSGQITYNLSGAQAGTSITFDATTGTRHVLPFGYGSGAGGTVTQATNKSTGVTLNTRCGQITMNAANLVTNTAVTFTLTNSQIAATDILMLNHVSGGTLGTYSFVARCAAGSATISVRNVTAGDLAEAVVIAFAVIKATTA